MGMGGGLVALELKLSISSHKNFQFPIKWAPFEVSTTTRSTHSVLTKKKRIHCAHIALYLGSTNVLPTTKKLQQSVNNDPGSFFSLTASSWVSPE